MSEKIADKIQKLLALAEAEAKAGNEAARDTLLEKASALQLKYAIADAMLAREGNQAADTITTQDFCQESNTPLIKAKREMIAGLASLYRGHAVLMGEWRDCKPSKTHANGRKYDKRAKVRVYAHTSDLRFISQMYTSLITQMQTMMAADERSMQVHAGVAAWRVSYAYAWVRRVYSRLAAAGMAQVEAEDTSAPGTALVLADRQALVKQHVQEAFGRALGKAKFREDNHSAAGHAAGRAAADRADLGGAKVGGGKTHRIEA